MTGWRLGYTAGPLEVIKAMGRLQSHMTSNPVTFGQYAAIVALGPPAAKAIENMRAEFERRGKYMAERLNSIPGVRCTESTGAFYCFPDVSSHFGRNISMVPRSTAVWTLQRRFSSRPMLPWFPACLLAVTAMFG